METLPEAEAGVLSENSGTAPVIVFGISVAIILAALSVWMFSHKNMS
ncbi:MAG: hypothetical protein AAB518_00725 [Patescibacteria group bacterium]